MDGEESTGNLFISFGIDNKMNLLMISLGFVCGLAISRVSIYKIVIFPASALVCAAGFSFGYVRGGRLVEVSTHKKKSKDEFTRVYGERVKILVSFFDEFDVKVNNLRNRLQKAIDSNKVSVNDLESCVSFVDSMKLEASNAKNVVEAFTYVEGNSDIIETSKSSSKKRKENGEVGFEFSQVFGSLFGERPVGSKSSKAKSSLKREDPDIQTREAVSSVVADENVVSSANDGKGVPNPSFDQKSLNRVGKTEMSFENAEEYNFMNKRLEFANESERWESRDNLLDSKDVRVRLSMKTEASFVHEEIREKSSRGNGYFDNREKSENEVFGEKMNYEDDSFRAQADHSCAHESEAGSHASMFADDVLFDKYLMEANDLLAEAKDFMRGRRDDERVELTLNKCAEILLKAIAMKPMSLLAIGQLGNTYLLHGEMKLYTSRKLRNLLSRMDGKFSDRQGRILKGLDDEFADRDKIISLLVNVCQQCEELLVKAGRNYRLALSIDGNDVKSLYNWGLALSYRAQLIADIGPEAASDADQVFLAAIDKFDAMMSKSNIYAPDALYRWGVTLQQRSRLRPTNSKEKVKLLQQAKTLFEDALDMDSENLRVREALSSCISELKYRYF